MRISDWSSDVCSSDLSVATILRWTFNLVALGVLLYAAFWLALLLVFAIAAAWAANNADGNDESETEWRNGPAGFGLYTSDGFRMDPHVYDADGTAHGHFLETTPITLPAPSPQHGRE